MVGCLTALLVVVSSSPVFIRFYIVFCSSPKIFYLLLKFVSKSSLIEYDTASAAAAAAATNGRRSSRTTTTSCLFFILLHSFGFLFFLRSCQALLHDCFCWFLLFPFLRFVFRFFFLARLQRDRERERDKVRNFILHALPVFKVLQMNFRCCQRDSANPVIFRLKMQNETTHREYYYAVGCRLVSAMGHCICGAR